MQSFDIRVFEDQDLTARQGKRRPAGRLRALAAVMLTLAGGVPSGFAQQAAQQPTQTVTQTSGDKAASPLPAAPAPLETQPLNMRQSERDYSKPCRAGLGQSNQDVQRNIDSQGELCEFGASVRHGEGWEDLLEPV